MNTVYSVHELIRYHISAHSQQAVSPRGGFRIIIWNRNRNRNRKPPGFRIIYMEQEQEAPGVQNNYMEQEQEQEAPGVGSE